MNTQLQSPLQPPKRIEYADGLRVMAILMVVCIHVSAQLFEGVPGSKTWQFSNLLDSSSRPAVPLFLMISGMLLLPPNRMVSLPVFFRRRFLRVAVPFIGWSIIYFLWKSLAYQKPLTWQLFLPQFLQGQVYYHLAFIYVIIGLYLFTPFLQIFVCSAKNRDYLYILGLWIFSVAITPIISKFFGIGINSYLAPMLGFTGYFIAGYYFSQLEPIRKRYLFAALLIAISATFLGTFLISIKAGTLDEFFYEYLSLNCIIATFSLFLIFKEIPFESIYKRFPWIKTIIFAVSSISFSVFLLHPIVMETFQFGKLGITLNAHTINPVIGTLASLVVILTITSMIALVMRRIPVIKWLFP